MPAHTESGYTILTRKANRLVFCNVFNIYLSQELLRRQVSISFRPNRQKQEQNGDMTENLSWEIATTTLQTFGKSTHKTVLFNFLLVILKIL